MFSFYLCLFFQYLDAELDELLWTLGSIDLSLVVQTLPPAPSWLCMYLADQDWLETETGAYSGACGVQKYWQESGPSD